MEEEGAMEGAEDMEEEGAMEGEEGAMEGEEGVMVVVEGVMVEVEAVMAVEAMEGAEVGTFKDHKGSLHQALASPPVQGYVCPAVCELSVCEMLHSLSHSRREADTSR